MIELKNISFSYKNKKTKSLNDVSLSIRKRDFCIVMGANGCGKSTLLKMISGEIMPNKGSISITGKVAKVVQDINLGVVSEMSILENLALSKISNASFKSYKRYHQKAKALLMGLNCNLEHELYKPVSSLSGGQRQMLATLMAMNSDKPILVLDEHTSALDISMQKRLMAYSANQIIERELTTVMITHKFDEALTFGNRLVIMSHGKIVCDLNQDDKKELNRKKLMDLVYGVAEMGACHGC